MNSSAFLHSGSSCNGHLLRLAFSVLLWLRPIVCSMVTLTASDLTKLAASKRDLTKNVWSRNINSHASCNGCTLFSKASAVGSLGQHYRSYSSSLTCSSIARALQRRKGPSKYYQVNNTYASAQTLCGLRAQHANADALLEQTTDIHVLVPGSWPQSWWSLTVHIDRNRLMLLWFGGRSQTGSGAITGAGLSSTCELVSCAAFNLHLPARACTLLCSTRMHVSVRS